MAWNYMKFLSQTAFIVRNEARYLMRFPRKLISAALLVWVPALYCVLYITSVWDPETKTGALPDGALYCRVEAFDVQRRDPN